MVGTQGADGGGEGPEEGGPRPGARAGATRLAARIGPLGAGLRAWTVAHGPTGLLFWLLALAIGVAAGYAAIGFRLGIAEVQTAIYGADDHRLHSVLTGLDPVVIILTPVLGGLVVGIILHLFTPDGRAGSVATVIEAAALNQGRLPLKEGLASAAASLVTLSTGGSTGREGPVVHLAATLSSWVSDRIGASPLTARDLMGCAVAAAVSASFNAPIAGALFAMEVVLRHFALHAFAPIVIASIAGAVVSRVHLGDITEFVLPDPSLAFYQELPAFLILGLVCGLAAVAAMKAILAAETWGDRFQRWSGCPGWLRPGVAGLLLGLIALQFPHVIGVGYETTSRALTGGIGLQEAIVFALVKAAALAITLAGRMGGGVFSPSLMLGALTGLAFGYIAVGIFPSVSGSEILYAMAGMGAVAASFLGAPLSTGLIIFELTGDWQTGVAVMASVSMATVVSARMVDKSFFLSLLESRNVHLAEGPQSWLPGTISVGHVMRVRGADDGAPDGMCWDLVEQGASLTLFDTLEQALPLFERRGAGPFIPVVSTEEGDRRELLGAVFHVDALRAYNRALVEAHREEHS
ncbi:chloride channel protein [Albimonas sp. CAU 1670]|uniref:chloride channel protein n=1 Tax=Albimonas sp. CAU 1670 TaxID=3032599 RepID=UPI0023DC67B2|nr:chloride channel protein [Albimonas sp. CAU 1670]MDF2232154.1 chloride channel protein [Albimonas sp. CAU 1670]